MPIEARKRRLAQLVRNAGVGLRLSEHLHGDGTEILEHACKLGCEGIVSKRVGSRYVSGRTDNWVKVKNLRQTGLASLAYTAIFSLGA